MGHSAQQIAWTLHIKAEKEVKTKCEHEIWLRIILWKKHWEMKFWLLLGKDFSMECVIGNIESI
jgi:hypothetical protein